MFNIINARALYTQHSHNAKHPFMRITLEF